MPDDEAADGGEKIAGPCHFPETETLADKQRDTLSGADHETREKLLF